MLQLRVSHRQSAGTFDDVEKPSSSYQKTKPVEAGKRSSTSAVFKSQLQATRELIASFLCSHQLAAAQEASRLASRTSPSRRRKRTGRGPRRSEHVDRPRRSRSKRRRAVKWKRRPRPLLLLLLQAPAPVPVPPPARLHQSSLLLPRQWRWAVLVFTVYVCSWL